jgi:hypothetical protein
MKKGIGVRFRKRLEEATKQLEGDMLDFDT